MRKWIGLCASVEFGIVAMLMLAMTCTASAATIAVPAGGDLQAALNAAQAGDTILLAPGATYVGNFVLPVHPGTTDITVRTGGSDALLPAAGVRMSPAYAPYLAKIKSSGVAPAMRTAPGAAYWRLELLEFLPNLKSMYDVLALGDGSDAQYTLSQVPHHLTIDRLYMHGDALAGQKRGIALNSGATTITNSYISDMKATGQDSQAIGGWNGSGPYYIANNYLEASGNGILIGGDDPKIPNLTPTDVVVRGNTISRPLSWRDPIVPTPANVRTSIGNDGSLAAGTYAYRVIARRDLLQTTAISNPTADITATVGAGGRVTLTWDAVASVMDYVVYGRTPGAQAMFWTVTGTSFSDTGVAGAADTPPSKGSYWSVKNLFELKNARHVQIDHNLMENNWASAQNGFAVLMTPRNQYGGCTWCGIEDVVFEQNVVRHMGGGLNITGYDDEHVSVQTKGLRIRNNEFSDYGKGWGGTGYFLSIANGTADVVVDHNTLISGPGVGLIVASGMPSTGFVFTNNVGPHDLYGIFGSGYGYGKAAMAYYFPDGTFQRNVLAGGEAYEYPAGNNLFPTVTSFMAHFTNYAAGDYSLLPSTDWALAGTDGKDLGRLSGDIAPPPPPVTPALSVVTTSLGAGSEGAYYSATLAATGGRVPYQWSIASGSLPLGVQLNALTGEITGAPVQGGDSAFTVRVQDAGSAAATRPLTLHVDVALLPVAIVTDVLATPTATVPFAQALEATGGHGRFAWSLTGGALPQGLTLSADGVLAGSAISKGTYNVALTAADSQDASRLATRSYALTVQAKANVAPTVSLTASATTAPAASTITLTAAASDADGVVTRVDLYVDGAVAATATKAPFAFTWTAVAGDHRFTALAVDDAAASTMSAEVVVKTKLEIVLHAADVKRLAGIFQQNGDGGAADGVALWNQNRNSAKAAGALASPVTYAEFQFYAEAGRAYHIWIRAKAQKNEYDNDSAYLQFSNIASALIGSTSAMTYQLEDAPNAGLANWGWQDNGLGTAPGMKGANLTFEKSGLQTLRIQPREDGLSIDQIVISPDRYLLVAPGGLKNDATIVAR